MAADFNAALQRTLYVAQGKSESRNKLIGAMRAAAARRGLTDDERRDLLQRVTGKRSAADLTLPEMGRVLDALNADRRAPDGQRGHVGKIRALWWSLYWLGEIDEPNDRALTAFVTRQTGVEALAFLGHRQAPAVIEALKAMVARAGVRWPAAAETTLIATSTPSYTPALADRHAVMQAVWDRLVQHRAVMALDYIAYVGQALRLAPSHHHWGAHELDAGLRLIGKKLRKTLAAAGRSDDGRRPIGCGRGEATSDGIGRDGAEPFRSRR